MYICVGFWFGATDVWSPPCELLVAPVKKLAVNAGTSAPSAPPSAQSRVWRSQL